MYIQILVLYHAKARNTNVYTNVKVPTNRAIYVKMQYKCIYKIQYFNVLKCKIQMYLQMYIQNLALYHAKVFCQIIHN